MTLAEQLAARGARKLDQALPDWFNQIDVDSLVMSDPCHCVAGQLGGKGVNLDQMSWEDWEDWGCQQYVFLAGGGEPGPGDTYGHFLYQFDIDPESYGMELTILDSETVESWNLRPSPSEKEKLSTTDIRVSYTDLQPAWEKEILSRRNA